MIKYKWALSAAVALIASAGSAQADCTFTTFGTAQLVNGTVQVTSIGTQGGGVALVPETPTTFAQLTELSTSYDLTDDGAGGGSPRFSIGLDRNGDGTVDGYLHVYIGTPPNYQDAPAGTQNTGDFLTPGDTTPRFDLSQFGGAFYATYDQAVAALGGARVIEVLLVADGGFADPDNEQTVIFDDFSLNNCAGPEEDPDGDTDGDGVPDAIDQCDMSDLREFVDADGSGGRTTTIRNVVNAQGCSIQDMVNECNSEVRNRGQYVSCIAQLANDLRRSGVLTNRQSAELKQAAARSRVGHQSTISQRGGNGGGRGRDDRGNGRGRGRGRGH